MFLVLLTYHFRQAKSSNVDSLQQGQSKWISWERFMDHSLIMLVKSIELVAWLDAWGNCKIGAIHPSLMNTGGFPIPNHDPWINNSLNCMMRIKFGLLLIVAIYQDGQHWVSAFIFMMILTSYGLFLCSGSHAVMPSFVYSFHSSFVQCI